MTEHILFLTGKLAEKSLRKILQTMHPTSFSYEVRCMEISVAALMTTDWIQRQLSDIGHATKIVLPGRVRGSLETISNHFSIQVVRGPEELKDLPSYFGKNLNPRDLSHYDVQIFAEIVDAPIMTIKQIVDRALQYKQDGANVIDLGCLPNTPFPHLAESVHALKEQDLQVSVDSLLADELIAGGNAGADYLLSITDETLWITDHVASIPIVIGRAPQDVDSLHRAIDELQKQGKRFIADSVLDPIHFGFTDSIVRYHNLRAHYPDIEMMMGIGNLTELTHADTAGTNALLVGLMSELKIQYLLTTEVSEHCRKVVKETDLARRIMYAAREDHVPPKGYHNGLMALHERKPFPYTLDEIKEFAKKITDPNFRIQVTEKGIHIYNKHGLHTSIDPYDLFPQLNVEDDGAHAFYLGLELARAQIAYQLGKRYDQDEELSWGVAVNQPEQDLSRFKEARTTLKARRNFHVRKKQNKK